jgi:hypothetical protein
MLVRLAALCLAFAALATSSPPLGPRHSKEFNDRVQHELGKYPAEVVPAVTYDKKTQMPVIPKVKKTFSLKTAQSCCESACNSNSAASSDGDTVSCLAGCDMWSRSELNFRGRRWRAPLRMKCGRDCFAAQKAEASGDTHSYWHMTKDHLPTNTLDCKDGCGHFFTCVGAQDGA